MNNFNQVCKTGNSVAEYTEKLIDCGWCLGTGMVDETILREIYQDREIDFQDFMALIKKIETDGDTECPCCECGKILVKV